MEDVAFVQGLREGMQRWEEGVSKCVMLREALQ